MDFSDLNKEDYEKALQVLREKGEDGFGILGSATTVGLATVAGAAAAPLVASALGGATLFGSTTLASIAGGVLTVTTPVEWVLGAAVMGGIVAFGLSRFLLKSGKQNAIRERMKYDLQEKIENHQKQDSNSETIKQLADILLQVEAEGKFPREKGAMLLNQVREGKISPHVALCTVQKILG